VLETINKFLKINKKKNALEISYSFMNSNMIKRWSHGLEKLMIINIDLSIEMNRIPLI